MVCEMGDGIGSSEILLDGLYTHQGCLDAVRRNHPDANGAKMGDHSLGDVPCYAEFGMTDWDSSATDWHTCMFTAGNFFVDFVTF